MSKTITLSAANHAFSRCIREVGAGEEITITGRGGPVARLVPVRRERVLTPDREAARARARARMEEGRELGIDRPLGSPTRAARRRSSTTHSAATTDTRVTTGDSYATAYTYDAAGNILIATYPSGRIVT